MFVILSYVDWLRYWEGIYTLGGAQFRFGVPSIKGQARRGWDFARAMRRMAQRCETENTVGYWEIASPRLRRGRRVNARYRVDRRGVNAIDADARVAGSRRSANATLE